MTYCPPRSRVYDPVDIPEFVRDDLRAGLTPDAIYLKYSRRRSVWVAAMYEEARMNGHLANLEPSAANVEKLADTYDTDGRALRWERIALQVYGDLKRTSEAKALYDEAKGREGAYKERYSGRGRRFPQMKESR